MSTEMIGRILQRTKELGISHRAASLASGMGESLIRDMIRRPGRSPTTATVAKLAEALQTTPEWLLFGREGGEIDPASDMAGETAGASTPQLRRPKLVRPLYGGIVQAGAFYELNDFDDDPSRVIPMEEVDKDYPDVPVISFDVAGDSMNALQPTPLLPGQRIIGLDFEGLRNRVELRDGMVVVVEQILNGGHLRERSVKQLKMHRDRTEFWPRSTNPKHKPIVVQYEMAEQGDDDGREVRVIAIVRRVVSDLPKW